ncbi:M23 family metallopeptidase [Streptomyces paludis]|uniref:LysM peptidoglycan-binding domain-containing protein n=1 Tax=Streptomyces paludis TaxID=2282738 RepID=A0A345HXF8_9ACTN|nr:M23 family metallopeptidase [Streptomyces paludis]AXG81382.1 LysM peptidoglycan-binding domain-containing protein [Streptomyces paludis]
MPAKGKHRRPKNNPLSRRFIAASTGGAAIALPLIGATGAHAAGQTAPAVAPKAAPATTDTATARSASTTSTATASTATAAQGTAATQIGTRTTARTYSVVSGDYLSKIAVEQRVKGGWQRLYEDNRQAIGADPGLIHPGLKLTLGAKAASAAPARTSAAPTRTSSAPAASAPRSEAPAKASESASSGRTSSDSGTSAGTSSGTASSNTATQTTGSGFLKPVDAPIGTSYRASGGSWSSGYHTGVDFLASAGSTVRAVGTGTVVAAGWGGSYGNQVVVQHSDGKYSQYAHLSALSVSAGQSVNAGQQIGVSGATGNVTGPHLHFEIRTGPDYGSDIDPVAYLRSQGVTV